MYYVFLIALSALSLFSAGHALLYRRDPRASLLWVLVNLYFIGIGPLFYWWLGVNRIRTHARRLRPRLRHADGTPTRSERARAPQVPAHLRSLLRLSERVSAAPLYAKNRITLLRNGEEAYPAMLEAVRNAGRCVYLSTYIFSSDRTGKWFVQTLSEAQRRGVQVRVLLDAFGEYYSRPPVRKFLRGAGIPFARFMKFSWSPRRFQPNLRNHRKILVVDGSLAFTGGMNIGERHWVEGAPVRHPRHRDFHFRVEGPVVQEIQQVFREDWAFATGESLPWIPYQGRAGGGAWCRVIRDGPNEDFERILWILLGAVNNARHRVRVLTPYFIPTQALLFALNTAALRGVDVEIILPERSNLFYVDWASQAFWWELLEKGVKIYLQPSPFHHGKLFLVDDVYAQVGSANWDPRSLRLNFELNVEIWDRAFCRRLNGVFEELKASSRAVRLSEVFSWPLARKLRNGIARLFSPYL